MAVDRAKMSGPMRPLKLPERRLQITDRLEWPKDASLAKRIHVSVGFAFVDVAERHVAPPLPREIFLRGGGRTGSHIDMQLDDLGECLSLLLQHGHTTDELVRRFKPDSLAWAVLHKVAEITAQEFGAAHG